MSKLVVFGLDCAAPQLVFEAFIDDLPNIKRLVAGSMHGDLHSTLPPITVPAWTAMMTSKDPGTLGCYGFRNRRSYGYEDLYVANSKYIKEKTIWNYLSRARLKSVLLSIPQTYPPKPLNGVMVADFMTPDKSVTWTYPADAGLDLDAACEGDYIIDVKDFRTDNKEELLAQIYTMTRRRFMGFRHLLKKEDPDFAMMVEMGIDRIHHGFWRFMDKEHRLYEPNNAYESAIRDYYIEVDREIGRTLDTLKPPVSVMIVSDHGAKRMHGAICINEWLRKKGHLTLKSEPAGPVRMKPDMVDWEKTRVWGEGGYYSRIFFNVKGREPLGAIPKADYEKFRDQIQAELEGIEDENGACIGTKVFRPEDAYRTVNNIAPDLIVYLGNLDWRSAATVGTGTVHLFENDTGPDDANHAEEGIFVWSLPGASGDTARRKYSIYDVAPSILSYFGVEPPQDMVGRSLLPG